MTVIIFPCTIQYDRHHLVSSDTNQHSQEKATVPWPEDHKQQTRERIIDSAASVFREQGIGPTTVAEIMQHAGLTHGGFYAHFDSKDDLVAEAYTHASDQLRSIFTSGDTSSKSQNPILNTAEKYLSPGHFAHPERGCPLAALGSELTRGSQKTRKAVAVEVRGRLDRLYSGTAARLSPDTRRQQAAGALACMVGGLIIARSLKESEGLELLQDCQAFLETALAPNSKKS
jgi:TetR/AcrR family transcriptional regulator, transcriptional repressor for nem operon